MKRSGVNAGDEAGEDGVHPDVGDDGCRKASTADAVEGAADAFLEGGPGLAAGRRDAEPVGEFAPGEFGIAAFNLAPAQAIPFAEADFGELLEDFDGGPFDEMRRVESATKRARVDGADTDVGKALVGLAGAHFTERRIEAAQEYPGEFRFCVSYQEQG